MADSSGDLDDPTAVLKLCQEYKQSRRQSILMARKRPISGNHAPMALGDTFHKAKGLFGTPPKRPNFDETALQADGKDPMDGKMSFNLKS